MSSEKNFTGEEMLKMLGEEPIGSASNGKAESEKNGTSDSDYKSYVTSAADLLAKEFPEPKYAVDGILPEGLTVFVGKPKLGKTWCVLGIAVAVASGGCALGSIPVEEGDVLCLGLEDGARRMQSR